MTVLQILARVLMVCLADGQPENELSDAENKIAEEAKRKAVAVARTTVDQMEQSLKKARQGRSPQNLQAAIADLKKAKKDLAAANRKPVADYLEEAKVEEAQKTNPANVLRTNEGLPAADNFRGDGLAVMMQYTVAYVPQGGEVYESSPIIIRFNRMGSTQGFFQINGKPEKILAESSDPTIVDIQPDPKFILGPFNGVFRRPGRATVTLTVGQYRAEQEIEVVQVPINADATSAEIIESMGFPTVKKDVYVKWPDSKPVDCFWYRPQAGEPFIGQHWFYEKYPSLVLSIQNGKLHKLGTTKANNSSCRLISVPSPNVEEKPRSAIE